MAVRVGHPSIKERKQQRLAGFSWCGDHESWLPLSEFYTHRLSRCKWTSGGTEGRLFDEKD